MNKVYFNLFDLKIFSSITNTEKEIEKDNNNKKIVLNEFVT